MVWSAQQVYNYAIGLINQYHPQYSESLQSGLGPNYFDCSGWCETCLEAGGIPMTRTTYSEFAQPNLIHSNTPQFMALMWIQVPGDAGSTPGIPDHVGFWINETTILEAPHTGLPVGEYPIPQWSDAESLICYGIPPYANIAPPVPPAPPPVPHLLEVLGMPSPVEDPGFAVRFLYRECLHREADQSGYTTFVNFLNGGGTMDQVMASLQDSPEGRAAIAAERKTLGI